MVKLMISCSFSSEIPFEIELEDEKLNKYEYLGLILLDITLVPRYLKDEKDVSSLDHGHDNSFQLI